MAMFGGSKQIGKQVLNQLGVNLLGVDVMGSQRRKAEQEALRLANMRAAGLLGPQPGAMRQVPVANGEGEDITSAFGPQMERGPSRTLSPQEIVAGLARETANTQGFNPKPFVDMAAYAKSSVKIGPDGRAYDEGDPSVIGQRFGNPTNVNGWVTDLNKPGNEGQYFPTLPGGVIPDGKGGVANATGLAPAMQEQTEAEATGRTRGTMFTVPQSNGTGRMMLGGQYLGGSGLQPDTGGQVDAPQGPSGPALGVTQSPDDAAYAGDLAKASAKSYNDIQAIGQRAPGLISSYTRINQLLEGFQTGRFTPTGKELASAASSLGVKVDPKWGNVEAANAIAQKLSLDAMGGTLGAGFSNADRDFVQSMNPSIVNTPQGRAQIAQFGIARAKREQQVAQMARQWQQRAGRLDKPDRNGKTFFDYLDAYAAANPLVPARR